MKKILMLCLALVMGVGMCAAQKAADKKTVTTVFTTDIDCEHCVKKIMNNVPSLGKGVKDVKVDLGFVIGKGGHHCPPFCFGCWAGSCTAVGFPRSARFIGAGARLFS